MIKDPHKLKKKDEDKSLIINNSNSLIQLIRENN
jgi:hypothetical protein